jgi:hypothetical protein
MKKSLILILAALMIPSVALAAKPAHSGAAHQPNVAYILHGTLSAYSPYDAATSTNGSITILVSHANYHGSALKGQSLTFPVGPNTRISLENGVTAIADNDHGIVKIRAAKRIPAADLASTLQASTARQIVDQGA